MAIKDVTVCVVFDVNLTLASGLKVITFQVFEPVIVTAPAEAAPEIVKLL